jgi:hypothetical protein
VATDASFDALCHEYRKVIDLLDDLEAEVKLPTALEVEVRRLTQLRAWMEEELLARIEGYQPQ